MEKACETFNVSKISELMLVIYIYQNAKLRRSAHSVGFFGGFIPVTEKFSIPFQTKWILDGGGNNESGKLLKAKDVNFEKSCKRSIQLETSMEERITYSFTPALECVTFG